MTVTDRLKELRERAGLVQSEIADKLGYKTQSGYQRYESATEYDKPYLSNEIVEKLIPILQGKGHPPITLDEILSLAGFTTVKENTLSETLVGSLASRKTPHLIPILEWRHVMTWTERALNPVNIVRYTDATHKEPGDLTFVLCVRDNSMESDGIKEGDQIVCDPSKPYHPGLIVVAKVSSQDEPVLGRYRLRRENGDPVTEILPSNSAWPPFIIDAAHPGQIVGRVVEHRRNL